RLDQAFRPYRNFGFASSHARESTDRDVPCRSVFSLNYSRATLRFLRDEHRRRERACSRRRSPGGWGLGNYLSKMAVTPCPPAAQIEIRPRPEPRSASALASVPTIRPPVAANGCPAASDPPLTFSLLRSMLPSGSSRPSFSLAKPGSSHALSVASTWEANASWIS